MYRGPSALPSAQPTPGRLGALSVATRPAAKIRSGGVARVIVGSGIDVIEIARVERALARSGERFERRVFTEAEIRACRAFQRPANHFALRFAAKEAALKALGTGWGRGVRWTDIETRVSAGPFATAPPELRLHGRGVELARSLCGSASGPAPRPVLALSRSRTHAVAMVILEASRT